MPDIVRDDWRFIPQEAVDAGQRQDDAQQWGDDQRQQLAQRWGDAQRAAAPSLPVSPDRAPLNAVPPPKEQAASEQADPSKNQFSPYDHVFKKYAGDLSENPEFVSIVAAGTLAESGWNAGNTTGDGGHSWGLFQMHDQGAGAGMGNSRLDPDAASAKMVPLYAAAYQQIKAQNPNLTGPALAARVAQAAERSADPSGRAYANAFQQIAGNASGLISSAGQFFGQKVDEAKSAIQNLGQINQPGPPIQGDYTSALPGGTQNPVAAGSQALSDITSQVPILGGPSVLDQAQTYGDIQSKYGGGIQDGKFRAPDYSNITPEDQEKLNQSTVAVGGTTGGEGPADTTGFGNFFGGGTGKALGDSLLRKELPAAEARMADLRAKYPQMTDEQAAQTPLGQQISRMQADAVARGIRPASTAAPSVSGNEAQQFVSQPQPEGSIGFPSRETQLGSREARDQAIQAAQRGFGLSPEEVTPSGGILRPSSAEDQARIQRQLDQQTARDYPGIFGEQAQRLIQRLDGGDESALDDLQKLDQQQGNAGAQPIPANAGIPNTSPGTIPYKEGGRIVRPPDTTGPAAPDTAPPEPLDQMLQNKYQPISWEGRGGGEGYATTSVTGPQAAGKIPGQTGTPGMGTGTGLRGPGYNQPVAASGGSPGGGGLPPSPPGQPPLGTPPVPGPGGPAPGGVPNAGSFKMAGVTPDHLEIAHGIIQKAVDDGRVGLDAHDTLDTMLQNGAAPDEIARFLYKDVLGNKPSVMDWIRSLRTGSMAGGETTEIKVLGSPIVQAALRAPVAAVRSLLQGRPGDIGPGLIGGVSGATEGAVLGAQQIRYGITMPQALTLGEGGYFGFKPGPDVMASNPWVRAGAAGLLGMVRTHGALSEISGGAGRGGALATGASPEAAQQVGQQWSLRSSQYGTIGQQVSNWLEGMRQTNPALDLTGQVLIPFFRVMYNTMRTGTEYSPAGAVGTAVDLARAQLPQSAPSFLRGPYASGQISPVVTDPTTRLLRNSMGIGLATLGWFQASQGNITGETPRGNVPKWSVQVGGNWIPLRTLGPVGESLAQAAILHEATRDGRGNIREIAGRMALDYKDHMNDETWLRTVLGIANAWSENPYAGPRSQAQKSERDIGSQAKQIGTSFVPQYRLGSQVAQNVGGISQSLQSPPPPVAPGGRNYRSRP